ncbi:MFS transporter [Lentisphaerota bacterium ZTH]|nr:MFS transporter [Lentisphaerota bacterium]WET07234.1 MFS transporter [Lentisphaerota bacterium ZTH]
MVKTKNALLLLALIFSFLMPAFILNCEGVVIMNLIKQQHVSMSAASWLQGCKDITIMISSFALISLIARLGHKKALLFATGLEMIICFMMATDASLNMARIYFILAGLSFAVIKISIYSSISLFAKDESQHAGFLSVLEGIYMLGILSGFWVFSFFMSFTSKWNNTFWFLGGMCALGMVIILLTPFKRTVDGQQVEDLTEAGKPKESVFAEFVSLFGRPIFFLFIILTFMYVFVEQSLTTWLPTYNNIVLKLSDVLSVQVVSIFLLGLAIGRLISAFVMKYIHWKKVLLACIIMAIATFVCSIITAYAYKPAGINSSWTQLPLAAYLIPMTGMFIGPIYPTICSTILTSHPKRYQVPISGLIIIFSAIGGTIGARIIGGAFENIGGINAMKIPIVPLVILLLLVLPYEFIVARHNGNNEEIQETASESCF